jgi:hypothetical protein
MKFTGLLLALVGWILPVLGLTWTDSNTVRLMLCLVGITLCAVGILGCLNPAYVKNAIWKK